MPVLLASRAAAPDWFRLMLLIRCGQQRQARVFLVILSGGLVLQRADCRGLSIAPKKMGTETSPARRGGLLRRSRPKRGTSRDMSVPFFLNSPPTADAELARGDSESVRSSVCVPEDVGARGRLGRVPAKLAEGVHLL